MRIKDEEKQATLIEATIKTVNDVGFAAASVSKIAKRAKVSPATLYIYYNNKEDLLVSTYIEIEKEFSQAILKDFDPSLPIRDILLNVWFDASEYITDNIERFRFSEQFSNSPYQELVTMEMIKQYYTPLIKVIHRGIEQKIIKDVSHDILAAFIFHPVVTLSKPHLCTEFEITPENIEIAFNLAWDAIKL